MDTYKGVEPKSDDVTKGNAVVVHPNTAPPPPPASKQKTPTSPAPIKNGK